MEIIIGIIGLVIGVGAAIVVQKSILKQKSDQLLKDAEKEGERLKKDSPAIMLKQIENYRSAGYPPYNGLVETACVVRENCRKTNTFNHAWYDLLSKYSRRDQLGFNYAAWLVEISYNQIEGSRASSPYFSFHHHHRG